MTESKLVQEIPANLPLVENLTAPELFASEASFFALTAETASVTFTSFRWDNSTQPPSMKRVVVGRVVMPIAAAKALTASLYDYLAKAGHDPAHRPADPKQYQ